MISDGMYDAMNENLQQLRVEVIYQNEYRKSKCLSGGVIENVGAAENDANKR